MKKNRHTIRLSGYDYSQEGWYFLTICIQNFEEVLGEIDENGKFIANELGKIVENNWKQTEEIRKNVFIDSFQLMPNHLHGIIVIGNKENFPNILGFPPTNTPLSMAKSPSKTIGSIVRGFKASVVKQLRESFLLNSQQKFWQRNYYERIVRNTEELDRIRAYIENNPIKWHEDKEYFKKLLKKMKTP